MKGIAITVDLDEVQEVAIEMTMAEYLDTILLLDKLGNGVLISISQEGEDEDDR